MELTDKVAVITGAAGGIGLAIAIEFLKEEIQGVLLTDINSNEGGKVLKVLSKDFGVERVSFFKLDVTNTEEYEEAFKKALEIFGKLDIIVNNAGIFSEINYQATNNVNFTAMINGTYLGLKYLGKDKNGKGGVIINQASTGAFDANYPLPVYTATKSGIVGLVRALGHPFHYKRTGVRVMTLCPFRTTTNAESRFEVEEENLRELLKLIDSFPAQHADVVGKAAVFVIKKGESGSVWVIDNSKLYKANIPDRQNFSEFITELI